VDAFLINKTTDMNEDVIQDLSEGIGTIPDKRQKHWPCIFSRSFTTCFATCMRRLKVNPSMKQIMVIGGGISGLSAAVDLARLGVTVISG